MPLNNFGRTFHSTRPPLNPVCTRYMYLDLFTTLLHTFIFAQLLLMFSLRVENQSITWCQYRRSDVRQYAHWFVCVINIMASKYLLNFVVRMHVRFLVILYCTRRGLNICLVSSIWIFCPYKILLGTQISWRHETHVQGMRLEGSDCTSGFLVM